jgi:hypothetical protein
MSPIDDKARHMQDQLNPPDVRYVKLGSGGKHVDYALENAVIPVDFDLADHALCLTGDWDLLMTTMTQAGRGIQAANEDIRELKDFYDLPYGSLWITMARGHLWWALAGDNIELSKVTSSGPVRWRTTQSGWSKMSLGGIPLQLNTLSSALTKTASYRRTICRVEAQDYLLRSIRGERHPLQHRACALTEEMHSLTEQMIGNLHWAEFEALIDLIFLRNGWRRTSLLGRNMPDVDLVLEQPLTGETAWVQVKSQAGQAELDSYIDRFLTDGSCNRFIFACADPRGALTLPRQSELNLNIWTGKVLASQIVESGLFKWLSERMV